MDRRILPMIQSALDSRRPKTILSLKPGEQFRTDKEASVRFAGAPCYAKLRRKYGKYNALALTGERAGTLVQINESDTVRKD